MIPFQVLSYGAGAAQGSQRGVQWVEFLRCLEKSPSLGYAKTHIIHEERTDCQQLRGVEFSQSPHGGLPEVPSFHFSKSCALGWVTVSSSCFLLLFKAPFKARAAQAL